MEILSESGGAIPAKVILCGPVTVSGTETWSSPLDETVEVTRWDDSALTLNQFVTVADGGSLTLENVALDGLYGEAETSVNTIVSVAAGGGLTLADGAAVRGSAGSGRQRRRRFGDAGGRRNFRQQGPGHQRHGRIHCQSRLRKNHRER